MLVSVAVCWVAGGLLLCLGGAASGQDRVMVTTDTPEYCVHLADQVTNRRGAASEAPEVEQLLSEGQTMCRHGQVEKGIRLLRQALLFLKAYPSP